MDRAANQLLKGLGWEEGFLFGEQEDKLTALILFIAAHTVVKDSGGFPLSTPVFSGFVSCP